MTTELNFFLFYYYSGGVKFALTQGLKWPASVALNHTIPALMPESTAHFQRFQQWSSEICPLSFLSRTSPLSAVGDCWGPVSPSLLRLEWQEFFPLVNNSSVTCWGSTFTAWPRMCVLCSCGDDPPYLFLTTLFPDLCFGGELTDIMCHHTNQEFSGLGPSASPGLGKLSKAAFWDGSRVCGFSSVQSVDLHKNHQRST